MNEQGPHKYIPLSLWLCDDTSDRTEVIGCVWYFEPPGEERHLISLILSSDGGVYSGTREKPNTPVVFVNSSVSALHHFVDAHSDYTNNTMDKCQIIGSNDFESIFASDVDNLICAFREIDKKALERQGNWWPLTINRSIVKYRSRQYP